MSNTWVYEVLVPRHLRLEEVRLAHREAERSGYSLVTPVSGVARVISLDGVDIREYSRPEEAVSSVLANGGGLQLWKVDIDILLTFHPPGSSVEASFDLAPEGWSRMTLSVDASFFRGEAVRSTVAGDMAEIFVGLCERLNAAYGFSRDEEVAEAFHDEALRVSASVAARDKPPLLFWMNYFRRDHFSWLDEALFSRVGGWATTFPRGMLVALVDAPWEVDLARLKEANRRWNS